MRSLLNSLAVVAAIAPLFALTGLGSEPETPASSLVEPQQGLVEAKPTGDATLDLQWGCHNVISRDGWVGVVFITPSTSGYTWCVSPGYGCGGFILSQSPTLAVPPQSGSLTYGTTSYGTWETKDIDKDGSPDIFVVDFDVQGEYSLEPCDGTQSCIGDGVAAGRNPFRVISGL